MTDTITNNQRHVGEDSKNDTNTEDNTSDDGDAQNDIYIDSKRRICLKVIGWRIVAVILTIIISFILLGDVSLALQIGMYDTIIKIICHYLYELVFNKIKWGKIKQSNAL